MSGVVLFIPTLTVDFAVEENSPNCFSRLTCPCFAMAILTLVTLSVFTPSLSLPLLGSWGPDAWQLDQAKLTFTFANLGYWLTHAAQYGYLPVTTFTYMLDGCCWHFAPWGMHLQSILCIYWPSWAFIWCCAAWAAAMRSLFSARYSLPFIRSARKRLPGSYNGGNGRRCFLSVERLLLSQGPAMALAIGRTVYARRGGQSRRNLSSAGLAGL